MIWYAVACLIVVAGLLLAQQAHYRAERSQRKHKDIYRLGLELESRLKDFDDLKTQVDHLKLRLGLKL